MRMFLINFLIGLLVATIAHSKGHSFIKWWINGVILGPFALIYSIFMPRRKPLHTEQARIQCPHCKKMVEASATQCPHCEKKIDIVDI